MARNNDLNGELVNMNIIVQTVKSNGWLFLAISLLERLPVQVLSIKNANDEGVLEAGLWG